MNLVNENQAHLTPKIGVENPDLRQFLRFHLQPHFTAVVEIDHKGSTLCVGAASTLAIQVTELINMPIDLVVPIPHLPPAVMGVYNWRGEILWVVDLGILLGLTDRTTTHHRNLQPTIAISHATTGHEAKTIGLVVDEIFDIEEYQSELIVKPIADSSNPELYRWIKGYAISAAGEKLAILDGQAIIDCADLHAEI